MPVTDPKEFALEPAFIQKSQIALNLPIETFPAIKVTFSARVRNWWVKKQNSLKKQRIQRQNQGTLKHDGR